MKRFDVDPHGDVLLILNDGELELRVSSSILGQASRVFRGMFGPNFAEGRALRGNQSASPTRFPLEDDDGQDMQLLCYALHHYRRMPNRTDAKGLLYFRDLLDKYECFAAVGYFTRQWFTNLSNSELKVDPPALVEAAYKLDDAQSFAEITTRMIQAGIIDTSDAASDEYMLRWSDALPELHAHIRDCHKEKIKALRVLIAATASMARVDHRRPIHWHHVIRGNHPDRDVECGAYQDHLAKCLTTLESAGVWGTQLQDTSLSQLIEDVKKIPVARTDNENICRYEYCSSDRVYLFLFWNRVVPQLKEVSKRIFVGVCLDCYKRGGLPKGEEQCRFKHEVWDFSKPIVQDESGYTKYDLGIGCPLLNLL